MSLLYKAEAERKGYLKEKDLAAELKRATEFILANDYIRFVRKNLMQFCVYRSGNMFVRRSAIAK